MYVCTCVCLHDSGEGLFEKKPFSRAPEHSSRKKSSFVREKSAALPGLLWQTPTAKDWQLIVPLKGLEKHSAISSSVAKKCVCLCVCVCVCVLGFSYKTLIGFAALQTKTQKILNSVSGSLNNANVSVVQDSRRGMETRRHRD